jgi:hypothetical protein
MLLVAGGTICTCALLIACASRIGRSKRKPYPKGKTSSTTLQALQRAIDIELRAEEIEEHINRTQIPARAMGVKVVGLTDNSLSLVAPLAKNSNVHGTAFAGSLYSVGTREFHNILSHTPSSSLYSPLTQTHTHTHTPQLRATTSASRGWKVRSS